MRCATLLLLLGPLRPADGVAAARRWLDAAQQPGEVRRLGCLPVMTGCLQPTAAIIGGECWRCPS